MLFRDENGNIVEINKADFSNDIEYYKKISSVYGINFNSNNDNVKGKIVEFIKQKK
jgi:hypothetical protein